MNIFEKIKFIFRKSKVVIVSGEDRACTRETIFQVLKQYFKVGKEVLILEADLENVEEFKFLLSKSSLPILVTNQSNEKTRELAKAIPNQGFLVLNFDDKALGEIKSGSEARYITFGFQEGADFQASDIKENEGINFKISYDGKIVPFWLAGGNNEGEIYSALTAICVGTILGLNLVEISQALKSSP